MATNLGKRLDSKDKTPESTTALGRFISLGARGDYAELPLLGRVWIELASHELLNQLEAEAAKAMEVLDVPLTGLTAGSYEAEKYVRTLAHCVRDESNHEVRFGTVAEWKRLDSDLLAHAQLVYQDVRFRLDPVGVVDGKIGELDPGTIAAIRTSIEKKRPTQLVAFGSRTLANFLLYMAERRAISLTPPLPSSVSSTDSSDTPSTSPSP